MPDINTPTTTAPAAPTSSTSNNADWLAIQMQAPAASSADIYSMGVNPSNATLQPASFYKSSAKVQAMPEFQTKDGKFNDAAFNDYYLQAQKSLNEFHKQDFSLGNVTTDLWDNTSIARALKAPIVRNPVKVSLTSDDPFTNLKVAQGSFLGLQQINKWSAPTKTIQEVAETQKVRDGLTGSMLDYTPNDTGLHNMFGFGSEPLALAQYDHDIKDAKGTVIHKRGELKYDDKGLPFYETLAGRDVAGRQLLSRWNTLTKDGSFANKFDFMDDDGIDKSLTGTIVKSVATLLPLALGGPVGTAYKAYYIASNLLDATAQIGKSVDSIINGDKAASGSLYKWANTLQGYVGQGKTTMSDYGKDHMFSLENLANQAVDAVLMMTAQDSVFSWPSKIKTYQIAKELNVAQGGLKEALAMGTEDVEKYTKEIYDLKNYAKKYGITEEAVTALSKNVKSLETYGKYSGYMATGYMAATMAVSMSGAAKAAGLNDRDTGMLYLGYMGALVPFFRTGLGRWVEHGLSVDALAADVTKKTEEYAGKYLPQDLVDLSTKIGDGSKTGKNLGLIAAGKKLGERVKALYNNASIATTFSAPLYAAVAGGLEMGSIEGLKTGVQGIYNSLSAAGLVSTKGDAKFDLKGDDILKTIGSAAFGGAFGGAIFKLLPHPEQDVFKSKDLMGYVLNGYGDRVLSTIEKLRTNGQLGSTTLSADPLNDHLGNKISDMWAPVNEEHPITQNDFIADRMSKTVKVMTLISKANDALDPQVTADTKDKFYNGIIDTATDTDLRDRIHGVVNKIYELSTDLAQMPTSDVAEADAEIANKKQKLSDLRTELEYLQGDESLDEFFRQGLFNVRDDITHSFGVKNLDDFAHQVNSKAKRFTSLTGDEKNQATKLFNDYKQLEGPGGRKSDLIEARTQYDNFNEQMEKGGFNGKLDLYKESLKSLKDYVNIQQTTYKSVEGEPISVLNEIALQDDFLNGLQHVKYIPDFMWDTIQRRIANFQSEGADEYLKILLPNVDTGKEGIATNLKVADVTKDPLVSAFMSKKLGEKEYQELLNSPEYKDLKENGANASDYSLLRVLKGITSFNDNAKDLEVKQAVEAVSHLTEEEAERVLFDYDNLVESGQHPELINYLHKSKFQEYLQNLQDKGYDLDDIADFMDAHTLLSNMIRVNHMSDYAGHTLTADENVSLIQSRAINDSALLDLAIDGKHQTNGNVINTNSIQHQDTSLLDNSVLKAREFDKQRAPSPLEEMLKPVNEFLDAQYQSLETVGYPNYMDRSEAFADGLKGHLSRVETLNALVESAVSINPLVNDFRKENGAGLDTDLKNTQLLVMSSEDASHLFSELARAKHRLIHLQEVNDYNKNNALAKLLRDSGLDLASKYQTLKNIATNDKVAELLPTLSNLFSLPTVMEYTNSFQTATSDLRNQAVTEMALFEHDLFKDYQKLDAANKLVVVNATFKPVDASSSKFYEEADGTQPYNDFTQTLYLAKVYGSSTYDFYEKYAGEYNPETKTFANLDALQYAPFTNQENAIRAGHLFINGDRDVIAKLFNAYATAPREDGIYNFDKSTISTLDAHSMLNIWGDPGTGKSTAVATGMVTLLPEGTGDVLLLAPRERQVKGLMDNMTKAGVGDRIDTANSKILRNFLKSLSLRTLDGKPYDVSTHDDKIEFYNGNGEVSDQFRNLLINPKNGILDSLDLYKDKSDSSHTLADSIANTLSKYKMITVDEYTHINPLDLAILSKVIDLYNGSTAVQKDPSKRILLLNLGDVNQMGYIGKDGGRRTYTDVAQAIVSQPLTTSLRSGWDLINNTLLDVRNRTVKYNAMSKDEVGSTDTILASRNNPIKTGYHEDITNGNVGIKVQAKQGDTTVSDLSFISSNKDKLTGKNVVYVVKDNDAIAKAQVLLKEALGDNWNMFSDIYTPSEVQGGEYKYAIIDAAPLLPADGDAKTYNIKRTHEFLNTMLSRGTEATLLLDDGSMKEYVTFDSQPKDKAIQQVKLDKDMIEKIKSDKQELFKMILANAIPQTAEDGLKTTVEAKDKMAMPVIKFKDVSPVFEPVVSESEAFAQPSTDLTTYNYYSTVQDYDNVFDLLPGTSASDRGKAETQKKISSVINSYKYYLLHKDELGDRQITLKSNFQKLFEDNGYDWENPQFHIEIGKRGEKGMNEGRTELTSTTSTSPKDIVISLKLRLPSETGDLELTMGYLNDIDDLSKRTELKLPLGEAKPTNLFKKIKDFVNENGEAPTGIGEGIKAEGDNRWISSPMSESQFKEMSKIYGSRIIYDNGTKMNYEDMKDQYFDFAITEPQIVVANLVDDNNKSVLDPYGSNDYKAKDGPGRYWNDVKGKAVSFISDVYELNSLSPAEMLDTYIKQLNYFNNDKFLSLDNKRKQEYIDELEDSISLPSGLKVRYKPGLVKLIKLDNPTSNFLDFRERFLGAIALKNVGAKMDAKLLEKFNTSLYVKDRLVKSLLTLREFLKDKAGREWFVSKVITEQNKRADNWTDSVYEDLARMFNDGEPVDKNIFTISDLSLQRHGKMTLSEFRDKLDELLDPTAEDSIFRGKYATNADPLTGEATSRKVYKADIDTNLTAEDLKLTLTGDKRKDFAGSLIDLKLFNLFKKTRNSNFADLIDLSLKALGSFDDKSDFRKYDLSKVFKNGQIENLILAQKIDKDTNAESNVLATAIKTGGDFSFNLGRLTHPFYSIDFNKLVDHLSGKEPSIVTPPVQVESTTPEPVKVIEPKAAISLNDTVASGTSLVDRLRSETYEIHKDAGKLEDSGVVPPVEIDPGLEPNTFNVTMPDGSIYEMEYNMNNDTVKSTLVQPAEGTDIKSALKQLETKELENYDKMVEEMFGDSVSDPSVKIALDYHRNKFRHTMLGVQLQSVNADISLTDYDASMKGYNGTTATNEYIQHITDNAEALRPFNKQLRNISDYTKDYTPKVC